MDKPVEVERGKTAADGNRLSRFVTRNIVALPADVCIDGTALRIAQRADGLDVCVDVRRQHSNNNSNWF